MDDIYDPSLVPSTVAPCVAGTGGKKGLERQDCSDSSRSQITCAEATVSHRHAPYHVAGISGPD